MSITETQIQATNIPVTDLNGQQVQLYQNGQRQFMTTLEIAEITGRDHFNIMEAHLAVESGYKTAKRYAAEHGLPTDLTSMQRLGQLASQITAKLGLSKDIVKDPNYPNGIGAYEEKALEEASKIIFKDF